MDPGGGVSRYYDAGVDACRPVSTEITGYTVSSLLWLHAVTGDMAYFDRALSAAHFLARSACDGGAMPFEISVDADSQRAYFFDCGIVVRGLLAAWDATHDAEFLDVAVKLGRAMAADFLAPDGTYHPIVRLPGKQPLEPDALRWSRAPGCYQLKSALAWWELFEATGDRRFRDSYDRVLEFSLQHHRAFLPGHRERSKVVDRLHAFLYFLEGLLPQALEKRCTLALSQGIERVSQFLDETPPAFERSDVYAQLLRIRIYASGAGVAPLDRGAARREASRLADFQVLSGDPRLDGGFYFGRRNGAWIPHVNPVSSAFAVQALALWDRHQNGWPAAHPRLLI